MSIQNQDEILAIDAGTGFVKCVCRHMRVSFPSVYATRRMSPWDDPKESTVETVGIDAFRWRTYPDVVLVRAVLEGRVADEKAFVAIIKEAARTTGCTDVLDSTYVVMGLPYGAAKQKQALERLVMRTLKPREVRVIPQAVGTMFSEGANTGIVMSIGQGTTELVFFENLKPKAGATIPQACDYLYDGLDYIEYGKTKPEKRRLDNLVAILANELAVFQTKLRGEYEIHLSGGGVLVEGLVALLQERVNCTIKVARDPVYSNAQGLYKLGENISSIEGQLRISQPR